MVSDASERGSIIGIALKSRRRGPMVLKEKAPLHKNIGLDGVVTSEGFRQVTLIESEKWADVQRELGVDLPWFERRANLLTQGIELRDLVGRQVLIGSAIVEILDELEPCARMHEIHPSLYETLVPDYRGGAFGRILQNGVVRVGDGISPLPAG
jgi:MOSC domain-containing protein YiiM